MVSVLIPVFNGAEFISDAIESVLNQTYKDFEIIVIDDGSTDDTAKVVSKFEDVRYIYQEHLGVSVARNRGIREAKGDIIAFIDSDDLFLPEKLQKQVEYLEKHPECDVLYTEIKNFTDIPEENISKRQIELMTQNVYEIIPTACIRKNAFNEHGYFDINFTYGEDTEWIYRLIVKEVKKKAMLHEKLYLRRVHNNNITLTHASINKTELRSIIAKSIINSKKTEAGMKLSVIIPAFNAQKYLSESIESVYKQNWIGEIEFIVIDDGSSDNTKDNAKKYNVKILEEDHQGAASARNLGIKNATGDYVLFLDADDYLLEGALESMYRPFSGSKNLKVVFGNAMDFVSPELSDEEKAKLKPRSEAYGGVLPGCALIKKDVFEKIGVFDTTLKSGETIDWMMKLKENQIPTFNIEKTVLNRRLHLTNTGRLFAKNEMQNYAALLRKRMMKK